MRTEEVMLRNDGVNIFQLSKERTLRVSNEEIIKRAQV